MNHLNATLKVGPARLGLGVFARRAIVTGESVGEVTGLVRDDPDYSTDYCMDLGGDMSLEPDAPFRYLNHSCDPNCELVLIETEEEDGSDGIPEIWLETLRPIAPGEEMTIDYGWPADTEVRCLCGSPRCRGWIGVSDDTSDRPIRVDGPEGAEPHLPPSEVHQLDASTEQPLSNPA